VQKTVRVNGVAVEAADIEASNGVIHVVGSTISSVPSNAIDQILPTDGR
jgi:uncharacterized surface protein with fasciclin (FAS1) repeats